jgi:hypothetical protein
MELHPYTGSTAPTQTPALRPKLMTWTSRVWRESPGRTIPMFKIEARLEPRDVEDNALSQALRPYAHQLQKMVICVLHNEEIPRLAPWAVGRFDIDAKSAYMFFHDYLAAPNGALHLGLMQSAGAATDIVISVVPMRVEAHILSLAVSAYDFGIHARIG